MGILQLSVWDQEMNRGRISSQDKTLIIDLFILSCPPHISVSKRKLPPSIAPFNVMSSIKVVFAPVASAMPHTDSAWLLPVWGWKALAFFCCADLKTSARPWLLLSFLAVCQRRQSLKLNQVASKKKPTQKAMKKGIFWWNGMVSRHCWSLSDHLLPNAWAETEARGKGPLLGGRTCREGSGCSTAELREKQAPCRAGASGTLSTK